MSERLDAIYVRDLDLYGYHGCSEAERTVGVRLRVSVEVLATQSAGETDAVEDTVDYAALARLAAEVVTGPSRRTLESLAEEIATRTLAQWPQATQVTVSLEKPAAPVPLQVGALGVRIVRSR